MPSATNVVGLVSRQIVVTKKTDCSLTVLMDREFTYICSSTDFDSISLLICLKIISIFETNYFFINFAVEKKNTFNVGARIMSVKNIRSFLTQQSHEKKFIEFSAIYRIAVYRQTTKFAFYDGVVLICCLAEPGWLDMASWHCPRAVILCPQNPLNCHTTRCAQNFTNVMIERPHFFAVLNKQIFTLA